jgi:hypothetical protein
MFEESSVARYAIVCHAVGIEGPEGEQAGKLQEPEPYESRTYPSEMVVQSLPEMDFKKLAGLGSESKLSFLEACHD